MLIDIILVVGGCYAAYAIVMSILDNGDSWATYKPKHKKKSKIALLPHAEEETI